MKQKIKDVAKKKKKNVSIENSTRFYFNAIIFFEFKFLLTDLFFLVESTC